MRSVSVGDEFVICMEISENEMMINSLDTMDFNAYLSKTNTNNIQLHNIYYGNMDLNEMYIYFCVHS